MRYGVIVCPRCRNSKVVDLSFKTTTCFRCNKKITLNKVRILFESNSEKEIRKAIGLINVKLHKK
ncbi:MAG: hypothetical protein QHH15_05810 [Candidatus Thermoplasmatota archaeon]|jgi:hypothetical protein|nr:hypothetical protein [Candidatus Thermoplasmatota archaeon]